MLVGLTTIRLALEPSARRNMPKLDRTPVSAKPTGLYTSEAHSVSALQRSASCGSGPSAEHSCKSGLQAVGGQGAAQSASNGQEACMVGSSSADPLRRCELATALMPGLELHTTAARCQCASRCAPRARVARLAKHAGANVAGEPWDPRCERRQGSARREAASILALG